MTGKDILECVQSSKSIIDTDSDGEKASPVLKSSEMRSILKKRLRRTQFEDGSRGRIGVGESTGSQPYDMRIQNPKLNILECIEGLDNRKKYLVSPRSDDNYKISVDSVTTLATDLVTLPRVRSNSWDAQLTIPNDPRYARLETNLGIGLAKEG
ncbi:hypothetical protein TNCV_1335571 [Trichonephila clavipes]|nr:hypothetical protein TNCV_1335571 [Trichonephila clavipes]